MIKFLLKLIAKRNANIQAMFDASIDARETPSGATKQPDKFIGD
jgi:hypothetical protein